MGQDALPQREPATGGLRTVRHLFSWSALSVLLGGGILGVWAWNHGTPGAAKPDHALAYQAEGEGISRTAAPLDPAHVAILRTAMLEAEARRMAEATVEAVTAMKVGPEVEVPTTVEPTAPDQGMALAQAEPTLRPVQIPLPVRRPPEFARAPEPVRMASLPRQPVLRTRRQAAAAPTSPQAPTGERSFLEELFGIGDSKPPALAYASLDGAAVDKTFRKGLNVVPQTRSSAPVPIIGSAKTAIYDITARVVHMPNGEILEAHSGYGDAMDDPRHVHVPMRGPTPPGTYDLTEREAPFHGVRAIRLTPSNGSPPFGRVGLLAHTYMLRAQPGASNGCVVFRDYDKFLQAFLRGDVQRLVVVASRA